MSDCVYWIETSDGHVKIGVTSNHVQRIAALRNGNHLRLTCQGCWEVGAGDALSIERQIHRLLAAYRTVGEWFLAPQDVVEDAINRAMLEHRAPEVLARWRRRFGFGRDVVPNMRLRDQEKANRGNP